jgi:hypothetical protein
VFFWGGFWSLEEVLEEFVGVEMRLNPSDVITIDEMPCAQVNTALHYVVELGSYMAFRFADHSLACEYLMVFWMEVMAGQWRGNEDRGFQSGLLRALRRRAVAP